MDITCRIGCNQDDKSGAPSFINSSYRLLDGYFSSSRYELEVLDRDQPEGSLLEVLANGVVIYQVRILSYLKSSSFVSFKILPVMAEEGGLAIDSAFSAIKNFFISSYKATKLACYVSSNDIDCLTIISKNMYREALLKEQLYSRGKYIDLNIYALTFRK